MLASTSICDSSVVDKALLDTTVIVRWVALDSLWNKTSWGINLRCIPRWLVGVEEFLLQTLRPATCFVQETANNKGKDSNLEKAKKCTIRNVCITLNRCWFSFQVCEREPFNCYCILWFYQIGFNCQVKHVFVEVLIILLFIGFPYKTPAKYF